MRNQSQSITESFQEGIPPKQNPAFATKNQGKGNPANNYLGNVTKSQTNSP